MKRIAAVCMSCVLLNLAAADRTTPGDIRARLEKMSKTHRILTDMKWTPESVFANPYGKDLAARIIADADKLLKTEPLPRRMTGRRLLEQVRRIQKRIFHLALAAKLTGKHVYADRAIAEMRSAANFSDWNPAHFLDPGEMSLALAAGYDWLEEYLTQEDRDLIRNALVEKALKPARKGKQWWRNGRNNWTQVCHAGLAAAALVTWELDPKLAAVTIADAVNAQEKVMRQSYSPNGTYPEGPGYWDYGTTYEVYLIALMEHAFGTDFGLNRIPGWDRTGDFMLAARGNSGSSYNYSDSGQRFSPSLPFFYLAKKFNRPDYLPAVSSPDCRKIPALAVLWLPEKETAKTDPPLWYWSGDGASPLAMMRTAWDRSAQFIGIKGGTPSSNHGHMDAGSFIYEVSGIRWVLDPGAENYTRMEKELGSGLWNMDQRSPRWKLFRLGPESHAIIRIGSHPQQVKGFGKLTVHPQQSGLPEVKIDLSGLYPEAKSVTRTAELGPAGLTITDRVTGLKPGTETAFQFLTGARAEKDRDGVLHLTCGKQEVRVSARPAADWILQDAETFLKPYEARFKPAATRVSFKVRADAEGTAAYTVQFAPVSRKKAD